MNEERRMIGFRRYEEKEPVHEEEQSTHITEEDQEGVNITWIIVTVLATSILNMLISTTSLLLIIFKQ